MTWMKAFAPAAILISCFVAVNLLWIVLYRRNRGKLRGKYPYGFGVIGQRITVSPEEAKFSNINDHDKPLIEKIRTKIVIGTVVLMLIAFLALNALHSMLP
jgi:hypothetical protein